MWAIDAWTAESSRQMTGIRRSRASESTWSRYRAEHTAAATWPRLVAFCMLLFTSWVDHLQRGFWGSRTGLWLAAADRATDTLSGSTANAFHALDCSVSHSAPSAKPRKSDASEADAVDDQISCSPYSSSGHHDG